MKSVSTSVLRYVCVAAAVVIACFAISDILVRITSVIVLLPALASIGTVLGRVPGFVQFTRAAALTGALHACVLVVRAGGPFDYLACAVQLAAALALVATGEILARRARAEIASSAPSA
jgi:hypothetical protein